MSPSDVGDDRVGADVTAHAHCVADRGVLPRPRGQGHDWWICRRKLYRVNSDVYRENSECIIVYGVYP